PEHVIGRFPTWWQRRLPRLQATLPTVALDTAQAVEYHRMCPKHGASTTRQSGGIGRHATFRALCGSPAWGFESPLWHHGRVAQSGLVRRFAKPLRGENSFEGSNPSPSARSRMNCGFFFFLSALSGLRPSGVLAI